MTIIEVIFFVFAVALAAFIGECLGNKFSYYLIMRDIKKFLDSYYLKKENKNTKEN